MNSYREKKERERLIHSFLYVFGAFFLFILIMFLFDLLKFEDFNEYSGPVKITFGVEDSQLESVTVNRDNTTTDDTEPEPFVEPVEMEPEIEDLIESEPIVETEPVTNPNNDIAPIEKVEEIKPVEVPKNVEPVNNEPVIQKGRESGNTYESSIDSSSSNIGRVGYTPIKYFMPLPKVISMNVYAFIEGDITGFDEEGFSRGYFEKFYIRNGEEFQLRDSVPYSNRSYLWRILEEAGYDLNNAEYKTLNSLKTVVIEFVVQKNSKGTNALINSKIVTSSGNDNVDEAVLYGFQQSTYSNSTNDDVKGRFKYSFN